MTSRHDMRAGWLLAALAAGTLAAGSSTIALAQPAGADQSSSPGAAADSAAAGPGAAGAPARFRAARFAARVRHAGPAALMEGSLLRAYRRLDLSDAQWQQVRGILQSARRQARRAQGGAAPAGLFALLDPADPGHAQAVELAKQRAADRIQQASDLQQQLYAVLTDAQKAQLTQQLAQRRARLQQQRGAGADATQGPAGAPAAQ